jgi:type I restriction enzyme S subunit
MNKIKFKDFVTLQRGYDLPKTQMVEGEFPVVGSTSIIGFHNEYKQDAPGVITGRSGSLGSVQYITCKYWPHNTSLWVKDFKGNLPRYVYYLLKTLPLASYNAGAGVPTLNRNHLDNLDIRTHDLPDQHKISAILSAYDGLIKNDARRIQIYEEIIQRIYREWFVDFRFPGHKKSKFVDSKLGKIPVKWNLGCLGDLVECCNEGTQAGEHLASKKYVPIDCISRKSVALNEAKSWTEAQSSLQLFQKGDILFGAMRPYFHKVAIAPFDGVTRTTCFVLRPKDTRFFAFALMTIFRDETIAFATTSSQGATIPYAVWNNSMENMRVLVPSLDVIEAFGNCVNPLLKHIQGSYGRESNLKNTRDILLQRIFSGEVHISKLDIVLREQSNVT